MLLFTVQNLASVLIDLANTFRLPWNSSQRQPRRNQQSLPQEIPSPAPRQGRACLCRQCLQGQVQVPETKGRHQCKQRPLETRDRQSCQGSHRALFPSKHCCQHPPRPLPRTLRPFSQERISQVEGYWILLLEIPSWLGFCAARFVYGVWRRCSLRCLGS